MRDVVLVISQSPDDAGELVAVARSFGEPHIVAFHRSAANAKDVASYGHKVYKINVTMPEELLEGLKSLYESMKPKLIIGPSSKIVKDALSVLAGIYDLPLVTEVTSVEERGEVIVYARGFLSERVIMEASVPKPAIVLMRQRVTKPAERAGEGEIVEIAAPKSPVRLIERKEKAFSGVKIESAEVVVGVGRGFRSKEDLSLAFELAKMLNGQVGASRPISTDLKWLPEDVWIGISGKRISPKLYIAVGISGAPQHMSGVSDSRIIVAINKDKSAPVFKYADYGIVGDLYKVLPVMIQRLKSIKRA